MNFEPVHDFYDPELLDEYKLLKEAFWIVIGDGAKSGQEYLDKALYGYYRKKIMEREPTTTPSGHWKVPEKALAPDWPYNVGCMQYVSCDKQESKVDHPSHYNTGNIEVIEVIEDWDLNFNLGNAVKYIGRAKHKGKWREDLEKAIWYIRRELGEVDG